MRRAGSPCDRTLATIVAGLGLAASLFAAGAVAQTPAEPSVPGAIAGKVIDATSGEVLPFCNVVLDSVASGTITDTHGRFILYMLAPGRYTVVVSRIGHATHRREGVAVLAGDTARVTIALEPVVLKADPIVVTASRAEQTARMAPASVSVITGEEMAQRAPVTFDAALEGIPGLNAFRSTGGISVQSMSIRGSSDVAGGGVGNRVLLLIDGRPALTSDSGGAFWSLVPVQFVDRVEVVKGAFSSLYGSTAMGGVINVITRRPVGTAAQTRVEMKMGFFEQPDPSLQYTGETPLQNELIADYSGSSGRVGYLVSASRKQSDGYAQNTAFTFYDAYGKLQFDISAERKLEFTLGGGTAENDYPHAWLSGADPLEVRAAYADDRQEKNYATADLLYWGLSGENLKYSMRAYYYRHEATSFFNEDDPGESIPGNEPFGLRTDIDGDKLGNLLQVDARSGRHHVVAGADYQMDHVQSSPDSIMYGDRQINNYAVFVQDDVMLARTLTATIGGRYDWNHLVGGQTLEQVSPKLALVWTATPETAVRALWGQAFRAPTIAELFLETELGGGVDFVPNPDLGAEHLTNSMETGVRWSPAAIFNLDVAAFRYEYEDLIYWEEISDELGVTYSVYQVRNLNRALMQGGEITLGSTWRSLAMSANYTYLDARDQSAGRADDLLAYRPEHSAAVSLDYARGRWMLHGDSRYRSQIEEVFLYPRQAPDAFWVFNSGVQCSLNGAWRLSLKVNNLTNAQYEELARYRMPGRNWMFGVALRL